MGTLSCPRVVKKIDEGIFNELGRAETKSRYRDPSDHLSFHSKRLLHQIFLLILLKHVHILANLLFILNITPGEDKSHSNVNNCNGDRHEIIDACEVDREEIGRVKEVYSCHYHGQVSSLISVQLLQGQLPAFAE